MRKLILISVLALASVTAQAGQDRGLLASGEEPNERIESVNPREQKPIAKPEAAKPVKAISTPVRQAYTPANRIPARGYENQEAEARRLAANYGISW